MTDEPATWSEVEHPLPSDARFREDLLALKEGDLAKAQVYCTASHALTNVGGLLKYC